MDRVEVVAEVAEGAEIDFNCRKVTQTSVAVKDHLESGQSLQRKQRKGKYWQGGYKNIFKMKKKSCFWVYVPVRVTKT